MDVSLSKKFGNHVEVIGTGTNLTGQDQINYSKQGNLSRSYFQRPTTFSLALRLTL